MVALLPAFERLKQGIASLRLPWSVYHIKYQESQHHAAGPSLKKKPKHKKQNRKEVTSLAYKWELTHYTMLCRQYSAWSSMFQALDSVS